MKKKEYWSGLPGPPSGDLPNPAIKPLSLMSPALAGRFITTRATREARFLQGTLQKGAKFIIIRSHEEYVFYGLQHAGQLVYIVSTSTERSSNLFKVTQLIRN